MINAMAPGATKYKTKMCKNWMTGYCKYTAESCRFAHGPDDLRAPTACEPCPRGACLGDYMRFPPPLAPTNTQEYYCGSPEPQVHHHNHNFNHTRTALQPHSEAPCNQQLPETSTPPRSEADARSLHQDMAELELVLPAQLFSPAPPPSSMPPLSSLPPPPPATFHKPLCTLDLSAMPLAGVVEYTRLFVAAAAEKPAAGLVVRIEAGGNNLQAVTTCLLTLGVTPTLASPTAVSFEC